ncbi:HD domain-containing protein, partial [bacterium]|nr:HD domain-containing protein [bacterium]
MTEQQLKQLKEWWEDYAAGYFESATGSGMIRLKYHHTKRVAEESDRICDALGLTMEARNLAHAIAILHDTGRFEQSARYGTFNDRLSENHALLGLREIEAGGILDTLFPEDAGIIRDAVANHNRRTIADGLDERTLFFSRLIRDADKLDISHVF